MKFHASVILGLALGLTSTLAAPEAGIFDDIKNVFKGISQDGKCDAHTLCPADGLYGPCCGSNGQCGSGSAFCSVAKGCLSGCEPDQPDDQKNAMDEPVLGKPTATTTSSKSAPTSKAPLKNNYSTLATNAPVTKDGTCGSKNGGTVCTGWPQGTCCSSAGWCGDTDAHCGTGCQSGPCKSGTSGGAPVTTDGTCGGANGGTVCTGWSKGTCCSAAGYCGDTSAHCGDGCQSGPCKSTPAPVTTNGMCGSSNGGAVCGNWNNGKAKCCSQYGYCGSTSAHCGDGCQSGACTGPAAGPAPVAAPKNSNGGTIKINPSTQYGGKQVQSGVPAMQAGLMPNGRVFFLDKIQNYTQIKKANGQYAYSAEYDPATYKVVPLAYNTNAFCAGGSFLPDGRALSVGGNADLSQAGIPGVDTSIGSGYTGLRTLRRDDFQTQYNGQDWSEPADRKLQSNRWYPSVLSLADGRQFVASGSLNGADPGKSYNNNPTWELLDRNGYPTGNKPATMDIIANNQPYFMYPHLHLLNDGSMFASVAKSAEVFRVTGNSGATVKSLPDIPGMYRTYPNTGTSVMLPLSSANGWKNTVIICGGGPYQDIDAPCDPSCGTISPLDSGANWQMEYMPERRGMVEGTIIADGSIIFLNGMSSGAQGFQLAKDPTYEVLIYDPTKAFGSRFSTGPTSSIARLYHSVSLMLLDGTVMVAGSNPVVMPVLQTYAGQNPPLDYVTEFRVETYTPPYLSGPNANKRPTNVKISERNLRPNLKFTITFNAPAGNKNVKVNIIHGGYVTHSLHMNQRSVFLDTTGYVAGATSQKITVTVPGSYNIVPPLHYVMYVLVDGVPAIGQFCTMN